jgi:hypothetical protein
VAECRLVEAGALIVFASEVGQLASELGLGLNLLAAGRNVSAGGPGFIETNPATFSGCVCAYMNTTLPPID